MIWLNLVNILMASEVVGIDPELMYSLCHTETRVRNVHNMNDGGSPSYGICQVKLATAKQFFPEYTAKDLKDPYKNALAAATYLKYQINRFGSVKAGVSAYNAGRPISGNKKYVNKVFNTLGEFNGTTKSINLVSR